MDALLRIGVVALAIMLLLATVYVLFLTRVQRDTIANNPALGVVMAIIVIPTGILWLFTMFCWFHGAGAGSSRFFLDPFAAYASAGHTDPLEGLALFCMTLVFDIWAFVAPGHLYARREAEKTGKWRLTPYVVSACAGWYVTRQDNLVWRLLAGILWALNGEPSR